MRMEGDNVSPANLSKSTLEKAAKFCKNAEKAQLDIGDARFPDSGDYVVFFLTNGADIMVVYCIPTGYIAEFLRELEDGEIIADYLGIKNIRHFVFKLAKNDYISWTKYNEDIMEALDNGDIDISEYLDEE